MNWTLRNEVGRLKVAVLGLRAELRLALKAPTSVQVQRALDATKQLSAKLEQLGALVEQMEV